MEEKKRLWLQSKGIHSQGRLPWT